MSIKKSDAVIIANYIVIDQSLRITGIYNSRYRFIVETVIVAYGRAIGKCIKSTYSSSWSTHKQIASIDFPPHRCISFKGIVIDSGMAPLVDTNCAPYIKWSVIQKDVIFYANLIYIFTINGTSGSSFHAIGVTNNHIWT